MEMTHEIVISIEDKVAASIAPKIKSIGESAKAASSSIGELKDLLKTVNAGGLKDALKMIGQYNKDVAKIASMQQESYNKIVRANNESLQKIERARNESNSRILREAVKTSSRLVDQERLTQAKIENITARRKVSVSPAGRSTGGDSTLSKAGMVGSVVTGIASGMNIISSIVGSGASAVNTIRNLTTSYVDLENRLKNVTTSQSQLNVVTEQMFAIANRTRTSVENTALIFNRFDLAMRDMGAGQAEVLRITETINKALIVSGVSISEQTQVIRQLSQAMNKGKLDGDEFRTVMETMPPVAKAIADTMKVAKGELLDLAPKGKITAQVMRDAFYRLSVEMDIAFEKTTKTIDQSLTVLKNTIIKLFGDIEKSGGVFASISNNIYQFSVSLNELSPQLTTTANSVLNLISALYKITPAALLLGDLKTTLSDTAAGITATSNFLERMAGRVSDYFEGFEKPGAFLEAKNYNAIVEEQKRLRITENERTDRLFKLSIVNNRIKTATEEIAKITDEQIKKDSSLVERRKWLNNELTKQISIRQKLEGFDELRQTTTPKPRSSASPVGKTRPMQFLSLDDITTGISESERLSQVIGKDTEVEKRLYDIREKLNNQLKRAREEKRPNVALIERELRLFKDQEPYLRDRISNLIHSEMVQRAANDILKKGSEELSKYNIQEEALNKVFDLGKMSLEKYNFELEKNRKEKENALNPLKKYTDELDRERELLGLTANEIELLTKKQEAMNAGMSGTQLTNYIAAIKALQKDRVGGNIVSNIREDLNNNSMFNRLEDLKTALEELGNEYILMEDLMKEGPQQHKGLLTYLDIYNKLADFGLKDLLSGTQLEFNANEDKIKEMIQSSELLKQKFIETGQATDIISRNLEKLKMTMQSEQLFSKFTGGIGQYFKDNENVIIQSWNVIRDVATAVMYDIFGRWKGGLYDMALALKDFTSSAITGISDIAARWIWMGDSIDDVKKMVRDLARSILVELTSRLIQNAIMKLIDVFILGDDKKQDNTKSIADNTKATLASIAVITAAQTAAGILLTSVWEPAAVAVSLATMGANAPGAIAAITGAYGALAATKLGNVATSASTAGVGGTSIGTGVLQLADGGLIPGGRQLVQVNELGQEFVMNAKATSQYRPMLESMNSGKASPVGNININIENYGTSKEFEVERLSPTEVRIIARDEIRSAVPALVSGQIANPNSEIGKSLSKNTNSQWRR